MPVTITRRTRGGFAVAAVVALALSACSPSNGSDEPSTSSSGSPSASSSSAVAGGSPTASASKSASPTPVPASSKGPAKNWPVPKMPGAAKEHSPKGAGAFSEYYFELIDYTQWTNDSVPIKKATSRSCEGCSEVIDSADDNKKNGAWSAGGDRHVTIQNAQILKGTPSASINFSFEQTRMVLYNGDGSRFGHLPATDKPVVGAMGLTYDKGWKVTSMTFVED